FKIVTAAAALQDGRRLGTRVNCPGQVGVGGERPISNAGGFALGRISFLESFARSCNTTFARQAISVGPDSLRQAAEQFGFNAEYGLGVATARGSIPTPQSTPELGQDGIGQGRVLASPLHMASVAAAVRSGTWRTPHLLADSDVAQRTLPARVVRSLRPMMRRVVTGGTGTAANVRGGQPVHGKTGTAQFGTSPPFGEHAWFVGYRGDVAFAVFVEGGGGGGTVAAPIAADFLRRL
ncbi:MAG: penicillin-binding transpeptidase domain-containing protein, partial [Egibacteraceae bacterium]